MKHVLNKREPKPQAVKSGHIPQFDDETLLRTIAKREIDAVNALLFQGEILVKRARSSEQKDRAAEAFARLYQRGQQQIRHARAEILASQAKRAILSSLERLT